jgi:hypothetical protein
MGDARDRLVADDGEPVTPAMSGSGTPIDRITLAGDAFAPRSSVLHLGPGDRPGLHDCSWWVYAAARRLPPRILASDRAIPFRGETTHGTVIAGHVRIADRHDDAYGTELLLAGLGSPVSAPIRAGSEDVEWRPYPNELRNEQ